MNEMIMPFVRNLKDKEFYSHKHSVIEMEEMKFLVKYSRPFYGFVNSNTRIKLDDHARPISFIRIAPIWVNKLPELIAQPDEQTCR